MNPMIKYRGGKSKEISHFISNMPEHYNRYIEPFFGGGALYFYLEPQNAIINDVNTKLITDKHYELLKRTEIYNYDYSEIFNMAGNNDFIFLDPPYDCVFSDYGNEAYRDGFGEDEHRRLANDFANLSCKSMLVIGKTALTEELYGKYIVEEYDKSYAVNIRNRFKADAKHIIVTNY